MVLSVSAEQITPANASRLNVAWTYDTREPIDHFRRDPRFEATPVYADGKLYISTAGGFVVALEAETSFQVPTSLSLVFPKTAADTAIHSAIARIAVCILILPSIPCTRSVPVLAQKRKCKDRAGTNKKNMLDTCRPSK